MNSGIYTATYSGVPVYEMIIQGVPVMRRIHDSYMNATQILKVAGVPKPKRTKILEREVSLGDYEKIQGGYGKYQGTWITLEASIRLCKSYGVSDVLHPLITFDPSKDTLEPKPVVVSRSSLPSDPGTPKLTRLRAYRSTGNDLPSPQLANGEFEDNDVAFDVLAAQDTFITPKGKNSPYSSPRRKNGTGRKIKENEIEMILEGIPSTPMFGEILSSMVINKPDRILQIPQFTLSDVSSLTLEQRQKEIIQTIYVYGDARIPQILALLTNKNGIEVDLALDDEENTPLHWAAAMCQLSLVAALVEKGANIFKTNLHGETAVVRALDFPSIYRLQCGPELFLLLRDAVFAVDSDEQTILHHLALASFLKNDWKITRYYSHCIFGFLKRESMTGVDIQEFLDAQDVLNNTALHYAVRQKFYKFAEILLKLGINIDIPNLSGDTAAQLAAKDFRMAQIFRNTSKARYGLLNSDLVDFDLLDDDMPTPSLSDFSDEEDIVMAAESLLHAKATYDSSFNKESDLNDSNNIPNLKKEQKLQQSHNSKIENNPESLISPAAPILENRDNNTLTEKGHYLQNEEPLLTSRKVIPNCSPIQIEKIKRLLEKVQDDMQDVVSKKARISDIYGEAKELEIKSTATDEQFQSSLFVPPSNSDNPDLDETLVELMNEHISELQEKVQNAVQTRKKMFTALEGLESSRASKDSHFRQSLATALGTPLEQLTPLLNDREGSNEGRFNQ